MAFATNTDNFYVPGALGSTDDLNTTWWSTYTISGTGALKRKSTGTGGSSGVAITNNTGTTAAFYKFSGMQNTQSITITGLSGLASGGTGYLYLRSTNSATPSGYRGSMVYSGGNILYTLESLVGGVATTLASATGATAYSDSTKTKYQLTMNATTIRWRFAAPGNPLTDVVTATNATYSSGTPGFGMIENTAGGGVLQFSSMAIDGANLAESNFMNLF